MEGGEDMYEENANAETMHSLANTKGPTRFSIAPNIHVDAVPPYCLPLSCYFRFALCTSLCRSAEEKALLATHPPPPHRTTDVSASEFLKVLNNLPWDKEVNFPRKCYDSVHKRPFLCARTQSQLQ
jgi:hypothetical protein